ncbi:restriction endonuclease subunit S [Thermomonas sp.]|uniref:restriction endonuclease subunit S n=1 Tax=Thermomonas sp. TaxID=1971895 RepID=UPI00257AE287|nr:restriction endonuclease subunit S [Thermomonas sp.]
MRLGDVLQLQYGKPLPEEERDSSGRYAVYGANGEKARSNRYLHDNRSIVVGRKGSAGEIKLTEEKFWPLDVTYFTTFDESRYDLNFLYYLLGTLDLPSMARGVKPGINRNDVYALSVNIPALPEQHRIVAILDEAFAGIAIAKANVETCLRNARETFDLRLAQIFSGQHTGWKKRRLDEVCAITSALVDPRAPEFADAIHVGAGNIETATGRLFDLKTSRQEELISGKFPFDTTMVLYSKIRPYLMKVARPDFDGICSADMYPLTPIEGQVTRDFLCYLLLSRPFTDYAIQGSARAGMPKVNRDHLFRYEATVPDVKEQARIADELDELVDETRHLESLYTRKVAALDELKQSLLQRAFSGNL